jgi:hypothetical protein
MAKWAASFTRFGCGFLLSGLLEAGHQAVGSPDRHFLCKVEGEFSQVNFVTHDPK